MNLKDILVHIDHRPTCASRLQVAIQLAKRQGSHLTGIYVIPYPYLSSRQSDAQEQAEAARSIFMKTVEAEGLHADWICVDSVKTRNNFV